MSRLLLPCLCLFGAAASAKPWNSIEPGNSTSDDVQAKFGAPTKRQTSKDTETWVYAKAEAISGTTQAQFRIEPVTRVVQRIDVYPEPIIDVSAIEKTYGPECKKKLAARCYVKRVAPSKHAYFTYAIMGLAIFFKDDDKTVKSFTFLPSTAPSAPSEDDEAGATP